MAKNKVSLLGKKVFYGSPKQFLSLIKILLRYRSKETYSTGWKKRLKVVFILKKLSFPWVEIPPPGRRLETIRKQTGSWARDADIHPEQQYTNFNKMLKLKQKIKQMLWWTEEQSHTVNNIKKLSQVINLNLLFCHMMDAFFFENKANVFKNKVLICFWEINNDMFTLFFSNPLKPTMKELIKIKLCKYLILKTFKESHLWNVLYTL